MKKYSDLLEVSRNHIDNVATHFKGNIHSWDVVNEVIKDDGNGPNNSGGYWFFNEDAINNNNDTILFVEGEHDVMMIWQWLKIEAVAICGKISESTLRFSKISDLQNKNIHLAFDNDKAGREYTDFFQNMFSANNVVKVVDYEGKDPDECLKNGGRFEL